MVWAVIFAGLIIRYIIVRKASGKMYTLESFSEKECFAVVLGAKVLAGDEPSDMLEDRLFTAVEGYKRGFFKTVLITGKSEKNQNEIKVMADFLVRDGVPPSSILIDGDSRTTKKSFQRLNLFHSDKSCVIITQNFHLPRALFLAEEFGYKPLGITADRRKYKRALYMSLREFLATTKEVIIPRRTLHGSDIDK